MKARNLPPIYPFILAIYPTLFLYSNNIYLDVDLVHLAVIVMSLSTIFSLGAFFILNHLLHNPHKSGLILAQIIILFFSYGGLYSVIEDATHLMEQWSLWGKELDEMHLNLILLCVWSCLCIMGAYLIASTVRPLGRLTSALNVISVLLISISLINVGVYLYNAEVLSPKEVGIGTGNLDYRISSSYPDIYYIILDGYANYDTLNNIYSYDNSQFYAYLNKRGFYIANSSRSNYAHSCLSLASSLNMDYLRLNAESNELNALSLFRSIERNKVVEFLKSRGYIYLHIGSGFGPTNFNEQADVNYRYGSPYGGELQAEFIRVLIKNTALQPFIDGSLVNDRNRELFNEQNNIFDIDKRERILFEFHKLSEIPSLKGPKFTFAHIICPHPSFVFGADGKPVKATEDWADKAAYTNQLTFLNKLLMDTIDDILAKSESLPIIVIQADHGSYSTFTGRNASQPDETMLKERMGILNAYYLPQNGTTLLYDSITPVNTFRLIFNCYFDTDYKALDDVNYYSDFNNMFDFRVANFNSTGHYWYHLN